MLRLDVLQSQWLILALVGGSVLVLLFLLGYAAAWRAGDAARNAGAGEHGAGRAAEAAERGADRPRQVAGAHGARRGVPWIVIVIILAAAAYAVVYVTLAAFNPPNV